MNFDPTVKKTVLVTGPNGFIGRQLMIDISKQLSDWNIKVISRKPVENIDGFLGFERFYEGDFDSSFFSDVTHVIHLVGLAHRFKNVDPSELERINVGSLQRLLHNLNLKSLEKLIFLSSYSVSLLEQNIVLDTAQYAITKERAEAILKEWYKKTVKVFEVVILRPAMVYGPGAPGNFERIQKLLRLPVPLPFGSLDCIRSFIHVKNLSSAMISALKTPLQAGITSWELSDPWSETFGGFVRDLNRAIHGKAIILKFPISLLRIGLTLLGKKDLFCKLTLSFQVDSKPFISDFSWKPPVSFESRFEDLKSESNRCSN